MLSVANEGEIGGASGANSVLTIPQGSLRWAEYALVGGKKQRGEGKEVSAQMLTEIVLLGR